ncbi:methyltransferase domain-containing protein [Colwellia sp. M166]|uniref:class I SAM-dependent methyltransferase n=1 Tax=Colwellia sp. M166 TaxID=2583805 RepID=UPI00211E4D29|nr:class I SAM-dependent methyltransferase [Colwellia sp. M166]UUO23125.1 methyltransferase domain-containing protein [Colwellia sp. M166]|tara:strand:- start:4041 stop:5105 length:1065 start_codon:yes stop_codon:yes gene_type:complete
MTQRENVKVLYQLNSLPVLQNRVYDTNAEAVNCVVGNMCLVQNLNTGLIYNNAFDNKLIQYDEHYQNEQALSNVFRSHLEDVASIIINTIGKYALLEIGCGKGYFLEHLLNQGFDIIGVDPSYQGNNENIIKQYYSKALNLSAKHIILRHVLEHIPHPFDFLQQLKLENGGEGKIYIEVPCFDWIIKNNAWFDIYYEHVNYFRLADFFQLFGWIYESGTLFKGQYIYVVAELSSLQEPKFLEKNVVNYLKFSLNLMNTSDPKLSIDAVWGASSKGVIYCLIQQNNDRIVDVVVDINPMKQNKHLPRTGIKVSSPEQTMKMLDENSIIYVMNSNYVDEIKNITKNRYTYVSIENG